MKKYFATGFIVLALLGLGYVQWQLLITGVRLEKSRFDQQIESVLYGVRTTIEQDDQLSQSIAALPFIPIDTAVGQQYSPIIAVLEELTELFEKQLHPRGITIDFSVAVTDLYSSQVFLLSDNILKKDFR